MRRIIIYSMAGCLVGLIAITWALMFTKAHDLYGKSFHQPILLVSALLSAAFCGAAIGFKIGYSKSRQSNGGAIAMRFLRMLSFWRPRIQDKFIIYSFKARLNVMIVAVVIAANIVLIRMMPLPYGYMSACAIAILYLAGQLSLLLDASRAVSKKVVVNPSGRSTDRELWYLME